MRIPCSIPEASAPSNASLLGNSWCRVRRVRPSLSSKVAVTTASPGTVVVHSYADGVAALKAGKKIDYVGATGIIAWDKWHNSTGEFEVQGWQPNGSTPELGLIRAADIASLLK